MVCALNSFRPGPHWIYNVLLTQYILDTVPKSVGSCGPSLLGSITYSLDFASGIETQ